MGACGIKRGCKSALLAIATVAAVVMPPGAAAPAASPAFSFGAAGDFGYTSSTQATFGTAAAAGLDFFLALGDTTYGFANESSWCGEFKSHVPHVLVEAGNHDTGESGGADLNALLAACPYDLAEPLTGRYGREWFFDYPGSAPLARFIFSGCGTTFVVDNETKWTCGAGGAHYNFVSGAIDGARGAGIPWVIVATHKNCITAATKTCEIGAAFFDMLLDRRVDLVLQGHDHVYERSKQLVCATPGQYRPECVRDEGADGHYIKGNGSVIVVQGTGGMEPYPYNASDTEAPYFADAFAGTFGIVKYTVNETSIRAEFLRSAGGSDGDSFVIEAPPAPPESPAPALPDDGAVPVYTWLVVAAVAASAALLFLRFWRRAP